MQFIHHSYMQCSVQLAIVSMLGFSTFSSFAHQASFTLPEMQTIPAGSYVRERESNNGMLKQQVNVKRFKLAKYEITVGEFRQFVNATGHKTRDVCWNWSEKTPSYKWFMKREKGSWSDNAYAPSDKHPVMCVTWYDAKAYAKWLSNKTGRSFRLPTEAEWEYAALGNQTTVYYFGNDASEICKYANILDQSGEVAMYRDYKQKPKGVNCDDGVEYTAKVGSFQANPFGLHDMLGNVFEFVEDCEHNDYENAPLDGSAWTKGCDAADAKILKKGGSYGFSERRALITGGGHAGKDNPSALGEGFRLAETIIQ
ncbi:formylglycine-generating enzyme family protein [Flocculibacter collagenilyticus]|uniref:formylglycine-generating enzyme family protein n=1 Tax=Flocculibacter collagenilyticus TaxID=2744479 RepID=UPI0018F50E42|nr:SUMF1/EgtB/PvdO family nonheme iron enzyme [Flocculibacter collagenilyticus]